MNKNTKYLIIGGAILLLLFGVYYFSNSSGSQNESEKTKKDTTEVGKPINPTGTYLLYNLLKSYEKTISIKTIQTTDSITLESLLPKENINGKPNLYINISEYFYLNHEDRNYLIDFVKEGNYAFISADIFATYFSQDFTDYSNFIDYYFYDTLLYVNFEHPNLRKNEPLELLNEEINFHGHPKYTVYPFFDDSKLNTSHIRISSSDGHYNCLMKAYGNGFMIVHTQPGNFSNINIATKDGKINAENIFSHFSDNNIHWHQNFGKYSEYRGIPKPKTNKVPPQNSRKSPLEYIISHPALFTAFILILIGLVIYMIVFSKRKQKIIPPIPANANSSLEFIDVVSKLYFQQKQHNKLVNHMFLIFVAFLRDKYYINISKKDPQIVTRISEKSGISEEKIKEIFTTFKKAKTNKFTEKELIELHIMLEYFYKKCN